jgi:hypothetical protein
MKKRNAPPREPVLVVHDVMGDDVREVVREVAAKAVADRVDPTAETRELFEMARDRLRRNQGLFTEADVTKRLFFALLETLSPEQRAEVRRRLGE